MKGKSKELLVTGFFFVLGFLCIRGFYDISFFYDEFRIVYGLSVSSIHTTDFTYYIWYLFFGILACASFSAGLFRTTFPIRVYNIYKRLLELQSFSIIVSMFVVVIGVGLFRAFVLIDSPIADDESTYSFIAKTLLHGRLINPIPEDQQFFANQFVVINDHGWFGKYPIGHPVFLAIGEIIGTRYFVGPLTTALSLLLIYFLGKKIFDAQTGILAICFLLISPHLLWTGATLLSQTTSTVFMLLGLLSTVYFKETGKTTWGWIAGLSWSYGVVIRPLPGGLFLIVVFAIVFLQNGEQPFLQHLKSKLRYFIPVALFAIATAAFMLFVNYAQTGDVLKSGYHAFHSKGLGISHSRDGLVSMSVAAALLRQNFWLFGWPISLLFVWFMKRNQYFLLILGLIGAEYAYRIIAPKTVVATTGPIYVTEIVPLLALATASGILELKNKLEAHGFPRAKQALISITVASTLVSLFCFWPVHIKNIRAGATQWTAPLRALEDAGVDRALVFSDRMVLPKSGASWAYYPPPPSPSLDDDIIFVRVPKNTDHPGKEMARFWKRRFPNRPAFFHHHVTLHTSELVPLGGKASDKL